jgi:hypothetical protein
LGPPIIGRRIVEATGGRVAGWPGGRVAGWPGGRVSGRLLGGFRVIVEGRPVDAIANPDDWADIEETQRDEAKEIFGTWERAEVLHPHRACTRRLTTGRGWPTALATGASATVAA